MSTVPNAAAGECGIGLRETTLFYSGYEYEYSTEYSAGNLHNPRRLSIAGATAVHSSFVPFS